VNDRTLNEEFDIDALIGAGLSYDNEQEQSDDFVAVTSLGKE